MNVLILEDQINTQLWLKEIVQTAFSTTQISITDSLAKAIHLTNSHQFDLALIDFKLPDGTGVELIEHIKYHHHTTLCVIISAIGDDDQVVTALSKGADGYMMKDQLESILIKQLQQLLQGIPALSPTIARRLMHHFYQSRPNPTAPCILTEREKEVLIQISQGLRNHEVAEILNIAECTVASHIKSIYQKLNISSRAEAANYATHIGIHIPMQSKRK
jgi:DNA-binding NarL/FixJ family response regulator